MVQFTGECIAVRYKKQDFAIVRKHPFWAATQGSNTRLMPDQLARTSKVNFGIETEAGAQSAYPLATRRDDVALLGGLAFGNSEVSPRFATTFGEAIFSARSMENGFCAKAVELYFKGSSASAKVQSLAFALTADTLPEQELALHVELNNPLLSCGALVNSPFFKSY